MTALRRSRPLWPSRPVRRMSPGLLGLSAALEWLAQSDIGQAEKLEPQSGEPGGRGTGETAGLPLFPAAQSACWPLEFEGIHHSDLVTLLAESGIALRAGQHCAQPLLAALGSAALRASFAPTIPKTMLRRWSTRWIAPWKFWWINDNSAPLRHNHYRRYAAPDLRPAEPVGGINTVS